MFAFILITLLSSPVPRPAQAKAAVDSAAVARDAVSRFYAWYVPTSANTPLTDMLALKDARWRFAPELVKALRADSTASAKSPDEIVGLDMDPFLNSQDPCPRYAITGVRRAGADFLVDVHGTGGCGRRGAPDVSVRVAFDAKGPVFVNVVYSRRRHDDLLSLLAQLAHERERPRTR